MCIGNFFKQCDILIIYVKGVKIMAFEVMSPGRLMELIGNRNYVIVDIREPGEYKDGHVNTAINIPYEKFEKGSFYLPSHKIIIVYCERGAASFLVARKLHDKGFHVCTVVGGYNAISKEIN